VNFNYTRVLEMRRRVKMRNLCIRCNCCICRRDLNRNQAGCCISAAFR